MPRRFGPRCLKSKVGSRVSISVALRVLLLCACAAPSPSAPRLTAASSSPSTSTSTSTSPSPSTSPSTAIPPAPPPTNTLASPAPFGSEEADQILFPDASTDATPRAACLHDLPEPERIACLLRVRYRNDARAAELAVAMHTQSGNLAGVQPERMFDGGYRGILKFVPSLPVDAARPHLAWVAAAFRDYEKLFDALAAAAPSREPSYRWRALGVRFFRSVNARTPSAYAQGWTIGYNLGGSLNVSEEWVRETMFHELFHLNDEFHADWSKTALEPIRASIIAKCKTSTACLTPYTPSPTIVRGSTYYAFHPPNGVGEYGGELALRYYREHRAILRKEPLVGAPFKCGPPENGRAWELLVKEFFAGIDLVPACAR